MCCIRSPLPRSVRSMPVPVSSTWGAAAASLRCRWRSSFPRRISPPPIPSARRSRSSGASPPGSDCRTSIPAACVSRRCRNATIMSFRAPSRQCRSSSDGSGRKSGRDRKARFRTASSTSRAATWPKNWRRPVCAGISTIFRGSSERSSLRPRKWSIPLKK